MSKLTKAQQAERAEAIETLRGLLKPGDNVTTTVMHVSKSGMSRVIRCQIIAPNYEGKPSIRDISWLVALACNDRYDDKHGGVVMGGCGMDMCFATVYNLGRVLFPGGFGIEGKHTSPGGKIVRTHRPETPEQAAAAVRDGYVFRGRNGDTSGWDNDGGYALDYR